MKNSSDMGGVFALFRINSKLKLNCLQMYSYLLLLYDLMDGALGYILGDVNLLLGMLLSQRWWIMWVPINTLSGGKEK